MADETADRPRMQDPRPQAPQPPDAPLAWQEASVITGEIDGVTGGSGVA